LLHVNHGGIAVVAVPAVRLKAIDVGFWPSTFECVAAHVTSGILSCLIIVYRPGMSPVTANFTFELGNLLDQQSTSANPVIVASDVSIRLERTSEPSTVELNKLLACYSLTQHVDGATHDAGGTLDAVCTRLDLPSLTVNILDIGLPDHRLLCWSSQQQHLPLVYTSSTWRFWSHFHSEAS